MSVPGCAAYAPLSGSRSANSPGGPGLTNGLISLIEQNRVSPSVSSLKKVLDGVPMSLAEFFTLDLSAAPQAFFGAEELVELGNEEVSLRLVAAQRPGRQLTLAA